MLFAFFSTHKLIIGDVIIEHSFDDSSYLVSYNIYSEMKLKESSSRLLAHSLTLSVQLALFSFHLC